ncbi:uncharacterized protein KZ484_019016 [Pholidichthys leucotaenia]
MMFGVNLALLLLAVGMVKGFDQAETVHNGDAEHDTNRAKRGSGVFDFLLGKGDITSPKPPPRNTDGFNLADALRPGGSGTFSMDNGLCQEKQEDLTKKLDELLAMTREELKLLRSMKSPGPSSPYLKLL